MWREQGRFFGSEKKKIAEKIKKLQLFVLSINISPPPPNLSLQHIYTKMSLISSVSGFAAFGVLVRTYALGLQKRPIFSSMF